MGIFLGAKHFGDGDHKSKRCLLFDVEQYRFQKFISDLAGMDIEAHAGNPRRMASKTRDWLATVSRRKTISSTAVMLKSYDLFVEGPPEMAASLGFDAESLAYPDYERFVVAWVKQSAAASKRAR